MKKHTTINSLIAVCMSVGLIGSASGKASTNSNSEADILGASVNSHREIQRHNILYDTLGTKNHFNERFIMFKTKDGKEIPVYNGSILNFTDSGIIGDIIRLTSALNKDVDTYDDSHTGILFLLTPREIMDIADRKNEAEKSGFMLNRIWERLYNDIRENFSNLPPDEYIPIVVESNGSTIEVLQVYYPYVHAGHLNDVVFNYGGNVSIRNLRFSIDYATAESFLMKNLGRIYENNILEFLKAAGSRNTKDGLDNVFCSELAAAWLRELSVIPQSVHANNWLPAHFNSANNFYEINDFLDYEIVLNKKSDIDGRLATKVYEAGKKALDKVDVLSIDSLLESKLKFDELKSDIETAITQLKFKESSVNVNDYTRIPMKTGIDTSDIAEENHNRMLDIIENTDFTTDRLF